MKYYMVQNTCEYNCNCVLWWQYDGCGYTTHVDEAKLFTKEEIFGEDGLLLPYWTNSHYRVFPADGVREASTLQLDIQRYRKLEEVSCEP